MSYRTALYFESRITIAGPVEDKLREIAKVHSFDLGQLTLNQKTDLFCFGRHKDYTVLKDRAEKLMIDVRAAGYQVARHQIQDVVFDEKFKS